MRKQIFNVLFSVLVCLALFSTESMAQSEQVKPTVPDLLQNGDPSSIKIGDYLGEKIDICIQHRVLEQDVNHLIVPFYNKTENHLWQSEFWGKWMLGAVLSYRYNQNPVLLDSIQKGVKDLLGSQLPNGYIGNYSQEAQLKSWDIWGRKYSMLGLLSYYDLTGDKEALNACRRMADHLLTQVGPGKVNIVTTGNYMGMASSSILEPMVFLYRRTGDVRYLDFAKYIVGQWETLEGPMLISKAEAGTPVAERFPHPQTLQKAWFGTDNGQKAYEMMSCYEGLLELYKVTNDPQYLSAVEKTVQNIIRDEINVAGSGSAFECWFYGKQQQTRPTYHTMETCVTMTWMKLCQTLLNLTGNPIYADQMEISTYNALLASIKDDGSQIAKYSPLEGQRHPGEEQCGMHMNCCNANGPRAFALLPQFAVMQSAANNEIYINLYSDFTATVPLTARKKVVIKQESNYPADGKIRLQVDTDTPETFTIAVRIPSWSKQSAMAVNGEAVEGVNAGSYYKVNRKWKKGDVITLDLDVRGRLVQQDNYAAIVKGPVVLARDTRFDDGFVDETVQIINKDNYVELTPSQHKPAGIWLSFIAPLILGTDLEGDARNPKQIHFCDFASAGNTWMSNVRYRVWLTETLNVRNEPYESYNK